MVTAYLMSKFSLQLRRTISYRIGKSFTIGYHRHRPFAMDETHNEREAAALSQ